MSRKVEKINSDHCFAQNLILCGSGPIQEPQKNVAKMTYLCKARNEASNCETDNWVHFSNAISSYLSHHTISNSPQTLCSFWISIALFCMYLARYWAPDSICIALMEINWCRKGIKLACCNCQSPPVTFQKYQVLVWVYWVLTIFFPKHQNSQNA